MFSQSKEKKENGHVKEHSTSNLRATQTGGESHPTNNCELGATLEERARAREGAVGCDNRRRRWRQVGSATTSQFEGGSRKKGERKRKRKGAQKKARQPMCNAGAMSGAGFSVRGFPRKILKVVITALTSEGLFFFF
jgi:hypothetical protein